MWTDTCALDRVQNNNKNNSGTIWRGSVLTGEEPPPHSGELNHALPKQAAQPNPSYPAQCRQDSTSPWSTDYGGNIFCFTMIQMLEKTNEEKTLIRKKEKKKHNFQEKEKRNIGKMKEEEF